MLIQNSSGGVISIQEKKDFWILNFPGIRTLRIAVLGSIVFNIITQLITRVILAKCAEYLIG